MRICIVIPVYNEEKRIVRTIEDLKASLMKRYRKDLVLLFVCDGSTDNTEAIIKRYAKLHSQIRLVTERRRLGKGGAVIKGFNILCSKYHPYIVGFVDADSSVPGKEILKLLRHLERRNVDGVIASRYLKNSEVVGNLGMGRFIASRSYNALVRLLFNLDFTDTQCGAKFFKARALIPALKDVRLAGMSFDINLIYEIYRRDFSIKEVPVRYDVMLEGTKMRLPEQVPRMFISTIMYRLGRLNS
ncbi:MAG: glycosyltransferase [Candidatus Micrarchaeaceae archaeon]|nr:glycosyltransferase [Candidatus Micrarchaeota archaeon]HII10096.1 glycosyltransferase [Candidatus Micrarchaeota archaeon]